MTFISLILLSPFTLHSGVGEDVGVAVVGEKDGEDEGASEVWIDGDDDVNCVGIIEGALEGDEDGVTLESGSAIGNWLGSSEGGNVSPIVGLLKEGFADPSAVGIDGEPSEAVGVGVMLPVGVVGEPSDAVGGVVILPVGVVGESSEADGVDVMLPVVVDGEPSDAVGGVVMLALGVVGEPSEAVGADVSLPFGAIVVEGELATVVGEGVVLPLGTIVPSVTVGADVELPLDTVGFDDETSAAVGAWLDSNASGLSDGTDGPLPDTVVGLSVGAAEGSGSTASQSDGIKVFGTGKTVGLIEGEAVGC